MVQFCPATIGPPLPNERTHAAAHRDYVTFEVVGREHYLSRRRIRKSELRSFKETETGAFRIRRRSKGPIAKPHLQARSFLLSISGEERLGPAQVDAARLQNVTSQIRHLALDKVAATLREECNVSGTAGTITETNEFIRETLKDAGPLVKESDLFNSRRANKLSTKSAAKPDEIELAREYEM